MRIINVLENSRAARRDKIVVVPTLVKRSAFLAQKMVGDLSDRAALLTFFNKLNFLSSLRFSTFRFKKDEHEKIIDAICAGHIDAVVGKVRRKYKNELLLLQQKKLVEENGRLMSKLNELAHVDHLTQVANRYHFEMHLKKSVRVAKRYHRLFAVLFVDVDNFKQVNDTLGHKAGDALLKKIATMMRDCVREEDFVARIGGDEFAIILHQINNIEEVAVIAEKIICRFNAPVKSLQRRTKVSLSIGVACYPDHATDSESLMKNADAALYAAKALGKNNYQYYKKKDDEPVNDLAHAPL